MKNNPFLSTNNGCKLLGGSDQLGIKYEGKEWKTILNECFRNGDELKEVLRLSEKETDHINRISERYPVYINSYYLSLINPDDPDDPVRKMAVPSEWEMSEDGQADTSGEAGNTVLPGMQHKYDETALILSTSQCSMYCRHCFRKRMVGLSDHEIARHIGEMADYIREHPEINNVLISGGDAFMNSNERIREYLDMFMELDQLDLVRFGTRMPVVLPQRINSDPELQEILRDFGKRKQLYVVTQFNHPNELTDEAVRSVQIMLRLGIIVKNQTVLLKGINDDPRVMAELLRKLTASGVVPYYIFQCRPVRGVLNDFQVPLRKGLEIVEGAKSLQNGQGKCIRYAMSHPAGKIEVIGKIDEKNMVFKFHQAKDSGNLGKVFVQKIEEEQGWLDEITV